MSWLMYLWHVWPWIDCKVWWSFVKTNILVTSSHRKGFTSGIVYLVHKCYVSKGFLYVTRKLPDQHYLYTGHPVPRYERYCIVPLYRPNGWAVWEMASVRGPAWEMPNSSIIILAGRYERFYCNIARIATLKIVDALQNLCKNSKSDIK